MMYSNNVKNMRITVRFRQLVVMVKVRVGEHILWVRYEGPHNYKKTKMCLCLCASHCFSELSQCFCTVTQQSLSCLLEARHPLVIPEVS